MAEANPLPGDSDEPERQGRSAAPDSAAQPKSRKDEESAASTSGSALDASLRKRYDPLARLFAPVTSGTPDDVVTPEDAIPPDEASVLHPNEPVFPTQRAQEASTPSPWRPPQAVSQPPSQRTEQPSEVSTPHVETHADTVTSAGPRQATARTDAIANAPVDMPALQPDVPIDMPVSNPVQHAPQAAPQTAPAREATRQAISLATPGAAAQPIQIPAQTAAVPRVASEPYTIRCRQCGKRASSELALCPHCGRELKAAPSRWLTIGLPALVGLLLVALLVLQAGSGPLGMIGAPVRALNTWISDLAVSLDPQVSVIPSSNNANVVALSEVTDSADIPPTVEVTDGDDALYDDVSDASLLGGDVSSSESETVAQGATAQGPEAADAETTVVNPLVPELSTGGSGVSSAEASAEDASPEAPVALPTGTPAPTDTPTVPPTATPLPTDTPTPEPTATSIPTNTPLPATYTVVAGDTAVAIAARLGVSLDDLLAYNNLSAQEAAMLQLGQVLQVPGGVVTPNTAAGESTYVVRQGDTLVVIAQRNGITVAQLMAANGLGQSDAFTLRPGQTLIIPGPTPTPVATAAPATDTPIPTSTSASTVAPATATRAPTNTRPAVTPTTATSGAASLRVTAPRLRAPISGITLACNVEGRLQWNASPDIEPEDNYRVHLGFVSGRDDSGNLKITWLVEQSVPSTQTQVALDATLCGTAPDDFGNQWRWYVDVVTDVNGTKSPVSTPSEIWGFAWQ